MRVMRDDNYKSAYSYRLTDAKVLRDNERFEAAIYLGGYAVECALKFAYRQLLKHDCMIHKLKEIFQQIIEYKDNQGSSMKYLNDLDLLKPLLNKSEYIKHWKPSLRYQGKLTSIIQCNSPDEYKEACKGFCDEFLKEVEQICFHVRAAVSEYERRNIK